MVRYINRLKRFWKSFYSCSFKVFNLRTFLVINPSVCFVVVVLSVYQVMWTISSAIQSSICWDYFLVVIICTHTQPALLFQFHYGLKPRRQFLCLPATKPGCSALETQQPWAFENAHSKQKFWCKLYFRTHSKNETTPLFTLKNSFLSAWFCRYSPSKCRANFSSTTAVHRP